MVPNGPAGIGHFEVLPPELIFQILVLLDVKSLFQFRRAHRQTLRLVDAIPDFKEIVATPYLLSAVLHLGALHFSVHDLAVRLREQHCSRSGPTHLATFLHLLRCERLCYPCLVSCPEYAPMPAAEALRHRGSSTELRRIPHVTGHPGR